ncbi:MAG: insulinase family protein [Acidobacteriota bacterium]
MRQDVDGATTRFVLRNGLTIIIRERHSQPLAAVAAYVKVGALNDSDTEGGLAQLTAKMLVKGTNKQPRGQLEREILRLGGFLESDVDFDHSIFKIMAPAESLLKVLELEADLLQNPAFPAPELKKSQLEVIRAGRRSETDTDSIEELLATAFTSHRVKRGRFGTEPSVAALTRAQVLAFYQANYQPQNTIISISGDVFTAQTIVPIQQLFGNWPRGTAAAPVAVVEEPPQPKLRYGNSRADIGRTVVTLGYRAPSLAATADGLKERATLEMLSAVLGLGQGSRLVQVLCEGSRLPAEAREKGELSGLITAVSSTYRLWPGAAMLVMQLTVDPARIDRAEAEYFREIERFRREVIGEGERLRARYLLEKRFLDVQSRVEQEADLLAFYQARLGESRLIEAYLDRLEKVTSQDIQQAAAKYLSFSNTSILEREPSGATPRTFNAETFAETMGIFAPTLAQTVKPEDIKQSIALRVFKQGVERGGATEGRNVIIAEAPLPVRDFSILRGARAFVREDRSQSKLVVGIFFQGGRLVEDQATNGLTELMLRAMLKSTTTRKGDLIAHEAESLGGEIRIVNEPDFFGLTIDVLSRNAEQVTRSALDILENPFFEKGELIRERDRLLADQLLHRDQIAERAEELMWGSLYPGHPYGLPRFGSSGVIKAATDEQLTAWHAKTLLRQYPMVVIVGDTDGSALVSRIFSEAFRRSDVDKTLKVTLPGLYAAPQIEAEARDRRETAQSVGLRTPAGQPNDGFALSMLAPFVSLRVHQAVDAEVSVVNEPRLASGTFLANLRSEPDAEIKAREALLAEFGRIAAAPPTGEDYDLVRNSAIGSYAIKVEGHIDRALEYARAVVAGRKASDVDSQPDLVRSVRLADIKRVADAALKPTQVGVGVVRGK